MSLFDEEEKSEALKYGLAEGIMVRRAQAPGTCCEGCVFFVDPDSRGCSRTNAALEETVYCGDTSHILVAEPGQEEKILAHKVFYRMTRK